MASANNIIQLPHFTTGTTYNKDDTTLYYNDKNLAYLPPQIFDVGINKLRRKTSIVATPFELTIVGDEWATKHWKLFPFLDSSQRDEYGRPIQKLNATSENKLKFVNLVHELFGTDQNSTFLNQVQKDMETEIVKRCNDAKKEAKHETDAVSLEDVWLIIKSLRGRPDEEAFNFIYNWVSSVTMESGCDWVEAAIKTFFANKLLPIALPPASSFPKAIERHSLSRIAIKKGTNNIKEKAKLIQRDHFGKVLILNEIVHEKAKVGSSDHGRYLKRVEDASYDIVQFSDTRYVPSSRTKHPYYYLKRKDKVDDSGIVFLRLTQAVNADRSNSLSMLTSLLTSAYNQSESNGCITEALLAADPPAAAVQVAALVDQQVMQVAALADQQVTGAGLTIPSLPPLPATAPAAAPEHASQVAVSATAPATAPEHASQVAAFASAPAPTSPQAAAGLDSQVEAMASPPATAPPASNVNERMGSFLESIPKVTNSGTQPTESSNHLPGNSDIGSTHRNIGRTTANVGDIGYTFVKEFEDGWHSGIVVALESGYSRCVYDDEDLEDVSIADLKELAKKAGDRAVEDVSAATIKKALAKADEEDKMDDEESDGGDNTIWEMKKLVTEVNLKKRKTPECDECHLSAFCIWKDVASTETFQSCVDCTEK